MFATTNFSPFLCLLLPGIEPATQLYSTSLDAVAESGSKGRNPRVSIRFSHTQLVNNSSVYSFFGGGGGGGLCAITVLFYFMETTLYVSLPDSVFFYPVTSGCVVTLQSVCYMRSQLIKQIRYVYIQSFFFVEI